MRWTELTLIPTALAMAAPVQWVACAGGPAKVKATTRSAISGLNGGMRDGRVLSRHSPAAPSEPNRSCQRQMTVLAFPVRRTISAVPCPAAVSRTILARQTCFCGLFRLATTAFNAARSVALSLIWVLSCIPQTRMTESAGESARESKSQIWSTSKTYPRAVVLEGRPQYAASIGLGARGTMPHGTTHDFAARPEAAVMAALVRRSIVLVGMMGAGKSSIGRRVALRLGIPFIEAAAEIEKAAGMSISDIFAIRGEAEFRA